MPNASPPNSVPRGLSAGLFAALGETRTAEDLGRRDPAAQDAADPADWERKNSQFSSL